MSDTSGRRTLNVDFTNLTLKNVFTGLEEHTAVKKKKYTKYE